MSININIDNISRGVSRSTTIERKDNHRDQNYIRKILRGECRSTDLLSYDQYEDLFRLRHDVIHWLICEFRDVPFGEKHIKDMIFDPPISSHRYYHSIKEQSPDIVIINGRSISITELTVSRMKHADAPKLSKYQLLIEVLKESSYSVNLEVVVINTSYSYPDHSMLCNEHGFSDTLIYSIYQVIETFETLIHNIQETNQGREWAARRAGHLMEEIDFGFNDDDVIQFHENASRKCFRNSDDLKGLLTETEPVELTQYDDEFIDLMVDQAIKVDSKLTRTQKPHDAIDFLIQHHESNAFQSAPNHLKSFMPLPYFESIVIDSSLRTTMRDTELFIMLTGALKKCDDPLLSRMSMMKEPIDKLKLDSAIRFQMALEGPGRRAYIRKGSKPHIEAQQLERKYWLPLYQSFNKEIEMASFELSKIDVLSEGDDLTKINGLGLRYVSICQSIFREICINSLRRERRDKYILKPTGVEGVFIFLSKGPKLRTGENLSIIWFKIICMKDFIKRGVLSESWMFKTLHNDHEIMHSRWLSTDANRLDHYLRSYDKILMSYFCYQSLSDKTLRASSAEMGSNLLGMIIMIYMEDKRSTSKMLQDVRYLIMTAVSMFNYYDDIIRKFTDPIRTPLQSYLLSRILDYVKDDKASTMILGSHFGKLNVEAGTGDIFDKLSGARINLPRILTTGPPINFKQMLCEMYFTMLFNKNQDDPTHASFQILTKILEGESMLDRVKTTTRLHMGIHDTEEKDILTLIKNPQKNQFSQRAIIIASKLQASSKFNRSNNGVAHVIASRNHEINKTLDNFATYKSSSCFLNKSYNPEVRTRAPDEVDIKDELVDGNGARKIQRVKVSALQGVQNPRRRCVEGVMELINKGYLTSFDLIKTHLMEPFKYQIFKKNQIGGVREILILDIHKRVLVNIMESISRIICHDDDREMLTHGDRKNMLIRDLIRHLKRGDQKKIIMNYNFDKTKWAPSFMPIQFLYMFVPFRKMYPSLFRFLTISLINHTNKEFILPERLIRVWNNDPENTYQHRMDPNLQKLKEEYLKDKKLSYINESNMGQGILHYTSSYFHLCVISLRDEIYRRLCAKMNIEPGEWRDLVSSDDSFTAHALPMDSVKKAKIRIILFMKAQEVTERAMNVWTSTSKSSISMLIYEFNSLFGSNMTMFPTIFKFALASVHPQNTDSFFRMVKEGYIASRQIVENGGSLELYMIAQNLNKKYAESIYHTHRAGQNDLNSYNLNPKNVPYQLGIYPIGDPGLMIMFGPEFHNYEILRNIDRLSLAEKIIFQNMHSLVEINDPEIYSAINSIDDVFVGVNRIEARMGPIRKLEYIKRSIPISWEEIQSRIINNPLMLFNKARNIKELEVKVFMKLYQHSAAEALRTTAASIYYGRVSASVTANAFVIPFVSQEPETYGRCISKLSELRGNPIDLTVLYPHREDYEMIRKLSHLEFDYSKRSDLETQNIRTIQTNKLVQRIHNPIISILNHFWAGEQVERPNSYNRDWINLQESVKVLRPSLEQTLDQFPGDRDRQIRALLLVILRLMSYNNKPMKAIIYGPSSRSFDDSYLILKQQNMYSDRTSTQGSQLYLVDNVTRVVDKLAYAFNIFALSLIINKEPIDVSHLLDEDDINSFFLDNTLSQSSYKKVLLMLIYHGHLTDLPKWSLKTRVIFHQWEKRGKQDSNGNYHGNYVLKLQLGYHIMKVRYFESNNTKIILSVNKVDDPIILYELLQKAIEISGLSQEQFLSHVPKGKFLITATKIIPSPRRDGVDIETQWMPHVQFNSEKVVYQDGSFTLFDNKRTIIMRTVEGLLHTNYIPEKMDHEYKIRIQGIQLSKLIILRPFNTFFSIEHIPYQTLLDLIKENGIADLEVEKPYVSNITNQRLGINYPERKETAEFSEIMVDPEPFFEAETAGVHETKTAADLMSSFLQMTDDDIQMIAPSLEGNFHDVWFSPNIDLNLIKTMTRQRMTYQPKKILERVLSMKYQIITRMITNINLINRRVIIDAQNILKNKGIVYSLIYSYDSQFSNRETPSPDGCELSLYPDFDKYYFPERYDKDRQIIMD